MDFGDWLQAEIDKRGWSQGELSRRTGLAQSQISKIINGLRHATPEHCITIAEVLGLEREVVFQARGWLLNGIENSLRFKLSDEVIEVAARIEQLPSVQRKTAINVTDSLIKALNEEVFA